MGHAIASRRRAPRRGFTLVELLFAIAILLVGVVAALKIFPPGFAAFSETQMDNVAQQMTDNRLNELGGDAANLPDAILPVEPSETSAIVSALDFNDLTAVSYESGFAPWADAHSYPFGNDGWPLWQPLSARILRRVIGEKVVIPSDVNTFSTATNTYIIGRYPTYIPRFAPVEASRVNSLLVYDLRYRKINTLTTLDQENIGQGKLLYMSGANSFVFKKDANARFVRIIFSCTAGNQVVQVAPAVWRLPPQAEFTTPVTISPYQGQQLLNGIEITANLTEDVSGTYYSLTFNNLPSGWSVIDGSEQLNRAFTYIDTLDLQQQGRWNEAYLAMQNLQQREFSLFISANFGDLAENLLSMIAFSKADGGKRVKIDYVVADWNILHDDVTVDGNGYVTLTALPKIDNRRNFPRAPNTWGLTYPMTGGGSYVMMSFIDLFTNNVYSVEYDPAHPNQDYDTVQKGYQMVKLLETDRRDYDLVVDMKESGQKHIRVGVKRTSGGTTTYNWSSLSGQTFRVYYRAQRDWAVQFFRAPAVFGRASTPLSLGWTNYYSTANVIAIPGIYAGQTIAVNYQYYQEDCRVTQVTTATVEIAGLDTDVTVLDVDNPGQLMVNDPIGIFNIQTGRYITGRNSNPLLTVSIFDLQRTARHVVLVLDAQVSAGEGDFIFSEKSAQSDIPLSRASYELHTVSAPVNGISHVRLKHLPAAGTTLTVRGASVVIRALWTQPRSGQAYIVDNDSAFSFPTKLRTINERWRAKTAIINLPIGED